MTTATQHRHTAPPELLALIAAATAQLTTTWTALVTAQQRYLTRLARIRTGTAGAAAATRAAGLEFSNATAAFDRDARALAERWAATDLPTAYRDGALRALSATRVDTRLFTWSTTHQAALTALTATYWADLTRRITEAVRRAQAFARDAAAAIRQPDGIDTDALLEQHPLDTVIYGNQHRHPAATWATAALTAQAAATAAHGAINTGRFDLDAEWMECTDGPECGFTAHNDLDHASGTIRTADEAAAYPIAHPGCIRSWTPRPDLNGQPDVASGDSV
jgi:hypothetical protein